MKLKASNILPVPVLLFVLFLSTFASAACPRCGGDTNPGFIGGYCSACDRHFSHDQLLWHEVVKAAQAAEADPETDAITHYQITLFQAQLEKHESGQLVLSQEQMKATRSVLGARGGREAADKAYRNIKHVWAVYPMLPLKAVEQILHLYIALGFVPQINANNVNFAILMAHLLVAVQYPHQPLALGSGAPEALAAGFLLKLITSQYSNPDYPDNMNPHATISGKKWVMNKLDDLVTQTSEGGRRATFNSVKAMDLALNKQMENNDFSLNEPPENIARQVEAELQPDTGRKLYTFRLIKDKKEVENVGVLRAKTGAGVLYYLYTLTGQLILAVTKQHLSAVLGGLQEAVIEREEHRIRALSAVNKRGVQLRRLRNLSYYGWITLTIAQIARGALFGTEIAPGEWIANGGSLLLLLFLHRYHYAFVKHP